MNPYNQNQIEWHGFLESAEWSESEENIFRLFYMVDNIDLKKYYENLNANEISKTFGGLEFWERAQRLSADPFTSTQKINCTPTFKAHFTKNDFIQVPEWFYIAYPDVVVWIKDNIKELTEEIEERIDELSDEDELNLKFYRMMIDRYKKTVGKLECSV